MSEITQLENLSNDLLLEIYEYLHALDLFMAFSSLNQRISSILSLTKLHVVISKRHCRYQIKFLSSCLTHHANQVVSISLEDQLRDYSSVISFFFNQHTFINLRSCKFYSICPSSRLNRVIRQLKTLTKLEVFQITQPRSISLSDRVKRKFSKTILKHKLSNIRIVDLLFFYDYKYLTDTISINYTLTSLSIIFTGSTKFCSIYSILPILHTYHVLRQLCVLVAERSWTNIYRGIIPSLPANMKDNLPVSSSLMSFDLMIWTNCDFDGLCLILRCMPNLRRFILYMAIASYTFPFWENSLNGQYWQQLLTDCTPHIHILNLDIYICIDIHSQFDINTIIPSFNCFATKYNNWYVTISQFKYNVNSKTRAVRLNGSTYSKKSMHKYLPIQYIALDTFNMHSTAVSEEQQHLLHTKCTDLNISIPLNMESFKFIPTHTLFRNINYLTICCKSPKLTFWQTLRNLMHTFYADYKSDQNERFNRIQSLVNLQRVTKLEFDRTNDSSQLHFIKLILLSCLNVIKLKMSTSLFLSSTIFNSSSSISSFHKLQSLNITTKNVYFPIKYASELTVRCPSLIHIEIRVISYDIGTSIADILLSGLVNLIHLKMYFNEHKLLDNPYLKDNIIKKRRQIFPMQISNEAEITVNINKRFLEIYLQACSICANERLVI